MNTELLVSWVSLSTLHTAGYNPRRMNEAEMAALKKSIQRFGFVDPIVVNQRRGKRWKAAEQEGAAIPQAPAPPEGSASPARRG